MTKKQITNKESKKQKIKLALKRRQDLLEIDFSDFEKITNNKRSNSKLITFLGFRYSNQKIFNLETSIIENKKEVRKIKKMLEKLVKIKVKKCNSPINNISSTSKNKLNFLTIIY